MNPSIGEKQLMSHKSKQLLSEVFNSFGIDSNKSPALTCIENIGTTNILTYDKLLSRARRIAYVLLTKTFRNSKDICSLKYGDRVALVYLNNDPINFVCSFYGCLIADLVPVLIEAPLPGYEAVIKEGGEVLTSCGVQVALTSERSVKCLPRTVNGEVLGFNGWPKLHWFITENLPKPPKDWHNSRIPPAESIAYIEQTTGRDGSVVGLVVSKKAMDQHGKMLMAACDYQVGETIVCLVDLRRHLGLWHTAVTALIHGLHVVFIPQTIMKTNPSYWIHIISKYRASVAIVKSRDLQRTLLVEQPEASLSTLRLLLVGDGDNPWSFPVCDQFLHFYRNNGLKRSAICPCAASDECLTVSIRRPIESDKIGRSKDPAKRNLWIQKQAYYSHLNCGTALPESSLAVVKLEGSPYLCRSCEVGEICVLAKSTGCGYWGRTDQIYSQIFSVCPISLDEVRSPDAKYARSGLLGFLGPGGFIFVCGSIRGLMIVNGSRHNRADIIATVLAVEKAKYQDPGQIAVFSIPDGNEEKMCIIAEQHMDCDEEQSLEWMLRVIKAIHCVHKLFVHCLALVCPNYLPRYPSGDIHISQSRKRFLEGTLHPTNVLMYKEWDNNTGTLSPSASPNNSVKGRLLPSTQGPQIVSEIGERDPVHQFIHKILEWRSAVTPEEVIFTLLNSKAGTASVLTCSQLYTRAKIIGSLILERAIINIGDSVALIFSPGTDLISAFYGCLCIGVVPVLIKPPNPEDQSSNSLRSVQKILDISKAVIILTNSTVAKLLKRKDIVSSPKNNSFLWPLVLSIEEMPNKLVTVRHHVDGGMLAYIDFSLSSTGKLTGIKMPHKAVISLCRSLKFARELYALRPIVLCLDPYSGLGLTLWCLSSVYTGHHSILIPPSELTINPELLPTAINLHAVRDIFCSYEVMKCCTEALRPTIGVLKGRGVSLTCVRACVVVGEGRPNLKLISSFTNLFSQLGLSSRAVSTSFGCRVNVAICLQNSSSPEPLQIYADREALRKDKVRLVEKSSERSECLLESGKVLPGVKLIIVNPETKEQCSDSHLGEIWVRSSHNASGYLSKTNRLDDHFNAQLTGGKSDEVYARTGYLGFIYDFKAPHPSATHPDILHKKSAGVDGAVFVVGTLDETIMFEGKRYCHIYNKY